MSVCDNCGNDYHRAFEVTMDGRSYRFDSFECAINRLAPRCGHCETRIIGHGVESGERIFCCAHCAERAGVSGLRDQA